LEQRWKDSEPALQELLGLRQVLAQQLEKKQEQLELVFVAQPR
jgi:hypothetical protein